ncbi:MAG: hypothetical protein EBV51_02185 [Acidimicrobiia bacterium]|nr:hypothetical protein [Acidimicrobiia bacterium]
MQAPPQLRECANVVWRCVRSGLFRRECVIYLLDTEVLLPRKNLRQTLRKEFSNYIRVVHTLDHRGLHSGR